MQQQLVPKIQYGHNISCGSYEPNEILQMVSTITRPKQIFIGDYEYKVKLSTTRLLCFKKSIKCVRCGIKGVVMSLDLDKLHRRHYVAHFNLYAHKNGKYVLMTKDHIVPVSKGGKGDLSNLQTMCHTCNHRKGNRIKKKDE